MGRIAVVAMPFASTRRPSLQVGLMTSLARQAGWEADGLHLNVEFAALLGRQRYEALCQHRGTMLSEWLFSPAAFPDDAPDPEGQFLADSEFSLTTPALGLGPDESRQWLSRVRSVLVPAYLEALLEAIPWGTCDVVAFTSTFQQNLASFALCRLIKERHPHVVSLFGGANFDGAMGPEYVRTVQSIDFAAVGEADQSFPRFLAALEDGNAADVPGICRRGDDGAPTLVAESQPFADLDSLPVPDYADYFERCERLGWFKETSRVTVDLPFESARGCWWGQKHHCIFCGLNSQTMTFRSKSADRVVAEIEELSRRHGSLSIEAVDNIIDLSYLKNVLPSLAESGYDWNIFYETKSNLSPDDLAMFAQAGVTRIQPGIESLATPLLRRMRKGVTGIQNVNLLRWCRHFGISVSWNLLWGFPDETPELYARQLELLKAIPHLQPPDGEGRLWLERFSPMFTEPASHGVHSVRPLGSYSYVYPPRVDLSTVAYFFDYEMFGALSDDTFAATSAWLSEWRDAWREPDRPFLVCRMGPGFVDVTEGRPGREPGSYQLGGELGQVLRHCMRRPISVDKLAAAADLPTGVVEEALEALESRALVIREDRRALALPVPV